MRYMLSGPKRKMISGWLLFVTVVLRNSLV